MAKYRLGDIAPVCQGTVADSNQCWLLNLDVVESNTGKILEYVYVDHSQIGASTVSFDNMNVLYSKLRPYLNKVVLPDRAGYATSEMLPLRPNGQVITREYLTYFLRSPHFVKYINGKTSGAKMPRANIADLKAVEIECPSIMEQNSITTQFDLIARLIEKRQKELSALDNLIKARFFEMFGNPVTNEKGWEIKRLGELATKIGSGATPKGGRDSYGTEGISLIRSMNVHNGRFDIKDLAHISNEQASKLDNVTVEKQDVLLNITGASVARCCIVPKEILPARVNQHVCIIRCRDYILPEFLNCLMIDDNYQDLLWGIAGSGATREAITKQQVENLQIITPPAHLQTEFTTFIAQVDKSKSRKELSYKTEKKLAL